MADCSKPKAATKSVATKSVSEATAQQLDTVKNKVCAKCGGRLKVKPISENSCFTDHELRVTNEIVCEECSVMAHAVYQHIFTLARKLVTDFDFKYYTHLNLADDGEEYCIRANTDGAIPLANWITKQLEEEHDRAVAIGMQRAKMAITIAMNTGSSTMHELRAVLDKEVEAWDRLTSVNDLE